MELDGANVVQVSMERKQASPEFVIPHFDFVVIASRYEQGLGFMKIYATDWTLVLFKAIDSGADSIVPQLSTWSITRSRALAGCPPE